MFLSNLGLEEKDIDPKEQLRIGIFAMSIYIFCFSVIDLELVSNNLLDHSLLFILLHLKLCLNMDRVMINIGNRTQGITSSLNCTSFLHGQVAQEQQRTWKKNKINENLHLSSWSLLSIIKEHTNSRCFSMLSNLDRQNSARLQHRGWHLATGFCTSFQNSVAPFIWNRGKICWQKAGSSPEICAL